MANSRKPSRSRTAAAQGLAARVALRLSEHIKAGDRLVVGLSGGLDSVVLLDCLKAAARPLRFRLAALHVNHQLSPRAGQWSAFCRRLCCSLKVTLRSVKVRVAGGASVEAAARAARYDAYSRVRCDYIVLAHQSDDQAETFLLQLLRGAGVRGLAAMPLVRTEDRGSRIGGENVAPRTQKISPQSSIRNPRVLRPLLDATRDEILEYARGRGLKWVEDESNSDTRFDRNFLRHEVLPVLARRYPSYRVTLARAAAHLAEAAGLMEEVAEQDATHHLRGGALAVAGLRRLPPARARNLLRYFIAMRGVEAPNAARLDEALRQLLSARRDAAVTVRLKGAVLRRYREAVHVELWIARPEPYRLRWDGARRVELPGAGGVLELARARGAGISLARLREGSVTIRSRHGGERLRPELRRPRRSLKNLLQEAHVAPWLRERLPLLFQGDTLVWVPGIGADCAYRARKGEPGLIPRWLPAG